MEETEAGSDPVICIFVVHQAFLYIQIMDCTFNRDMKVLYSVTLYILIYCFKIH